MKKLLLAMILLIGGGVFAFGQQIPMQIIKDGPIGQNNPLAPPHPWYITQDENVLTMPAFAENFTLQLRDTNNTIPTLIMLIIIIADGWNCF